MSPGCPFKTGEKVFCYHGPLLYEAKILSLRLEKDKTIKKLFLHYNGWSKKWDEWVSEDRVFQINDETIQKKRELESAQKKADRIKALKKSSSRIVGKKKVSQTQENAAQRNGLNPKSTLSTKRKRTSTCESDNKLENGDNESENLENEDYTKVWKGCQASKCKNEVLREPGVPFEPCPECNEKQIREAFRYKSMHKQVEHKATPHRDLIIWFKRLKDLGFEFTSIPNICNENHTISTDHSASETPRKTHAVHADLKRHRCLVCPFSFNYPSDLKRHLITHTGKRPHNCDLCQRSFIRPDALRSHQLTHAAVKLHQCSICNKGYTRKSHVERHIAAVHLKISNENYTSSTDHLATETPKKNHIIGADLKRHRCHMCPFSFKLLGDLKRHLMTHTGKRPHTCDLCQRSFTRPDSLRYHRLVHSPEKLHKCSICNKGYTRKSAVEKHIADVHPDISNDNDSMDADLKSNRCHMCSISFNQLSALKRHLIIHTRKCLHTCNVCQRSFTRANYLRSHQFTHSEEKPYQCPICNSGFTRKSFVARHIAALHRKIEDENRTSSKDHPATETPEKTHGMDADLKIHQCHICPFSFNAPHNLKRHLTTHLEKRPHACDLCQRSFSRSDYLRVHRYTHLAEKRFQCSICNMRFTTMSSVQRHIGAIH